MKYEVLNNQIIFDKNDDFDAASILECGQLFRFFKTEIGYKVVSGKEVAEITESEDKVIISCTNAPYFVSYFDLETDYSSIKKDLSEYDFLIEPIKKGKGIRIVKGEAEEIIFQFIISQNNNIKRIQKIVEKLSLIGEKINDEFNAFPTAKKLIQMPMEYFSSLGAGYRDKYLYETAKVLSETSLEEKKKLNDKELYSWLVSLKGVGPKVASCIMLFGFNRLSSFPVDTWIEKVYRKYLYVGEKTRPQISAYLEKKFGKLSGIVQQYLFYYIRSNFGHETIDASKK